MLHMNPMQPHQPMNQPCTLEINVISAEDLRIHGRPIKKNAITYVLRDSCKVVSTKVNKADGAYTFWDEKFDVVFPANARNLGIEVFSGNVLLGNASIPASEFLADYTPPHLLHLLSYRLRDRQGKRNGIVNLSDKSSFTILVDDHNNDNIRKRCSAYGQLGLMKEAHEGMSFSSRRNEHEIRRNEKMEKKDEYV
ncbi:hypothetical protein Cgig2_025382 [Carnegiea gigantea]|uniref:C2 domain-containing protein n=1 Tax=Carnegiea gigantea TaxID=171969 RepID=A0A9Q1GU30_9CARY|nr:hypothetical protein Cgig2_025382 [Carnegiea gigantea]